MKLDFWYKIPVGEMKTRWLGEVLNQAKHGRNLSLQALPQTNPVTISCNQQGLYSNQRYKS